MHEIYLKITAEDKNTAESLYNQIVKKVDKGNVEFGVGLEVTRIEEPSEHTEGFNE